MAAGSDIHTEEFPECRKAAAAFDGAFASSTAAFRKEEKEQTPLAALEAVGAAVAASLQAVRAGYERCDQEIDRESTAWLRRMAAAAASEVRERAALEARKEELEKAAQQCRVEQRALKRRRRGLDELRNVISSEVWEAIARAADRVPLEVDGEYFEASVHSLRRSPWFARKLSEVSSWCDGGETGVSFLTCARSWPMLRVPRKGVHIRPILNFLRAGLGNIVGLMTHLSEQERAAILAEAIFFELPSLAGQMAVPQTNCEVEIAIPSATLQARGVNAVLYHKTCESWHEPGRCFRLSCRREGHAITSGVVRSYGRRPNSIAKEAEATDCSSVWGQPVWMVKTHGELFEVLLSQLVVPDASQQQEALVVHALMHGTSCR
eukprot:TRINITY_DN23802_c0_g1_i1.p1 TRINITY_DN23802_c0_g1~~TRINITY_DN23802_c0_g1_i1.p1  ORF type:complete len:430 (+),score=64.93 TRINITY_DN23802_c0_g1_i1:155-1291(+)